MKKFGTCFLLGLLFLVLGTPLLPGRSWNAEADTIEVPVDRWLLFGPVKAPLPAFSDRDARQGASWALDESFLDLGELGPGPGQEIAWPGSKMWGIPSRSKSRLCCNMAFLLSGATIPMVMPSVSSTLFK